MLPRITFFTFASESPEIKKNIRLNIRGLVKKFQVEVHDLTGHVAMSCWPPDIVSFNLISLLRLWILGAQF